MLTQNGSDIDFTINRELFKFQYLPDFASFILHKKLKEFAVVGIRFSREAKLPLLKPLSRFSEKELVDLSLVSNREMLEALTRNDAAAYIESNGKKWISNALGIVDKAEIV